MNDEPRQNISEYPSIINSPPAEGDANTTGRAPMPAGHERESASQQRYAASVGHVPERAELAESGHKPRASGPPPESDPADQTLNPESQETGPRRESIQQHQRGRPPDPPDRAEPDKDYSDQPPGDSTRPPERSSTQTSEQAAQSERGPPHPPELTRPSDQVPVPPPEHRPQVSNDPPDRRRDGNTGYDPRPKQPIVRHTINDMQMDHERAPETEMELDE